MVEINKLVKEFKVNDKRSLKDYFISNAFVKQALNIDSLEIGTGEKIGLVGLNGSGKSTLIKCMLGIISPTRGNVYLMNKNPVKKRRKVSKYYGAMFGQRTQLKWDLPAIETYKVLKAIYDIPESEYNKRLEILIEKLQIEELMYQPVRTLSLGQKARVEIGAVFLHNPKLLILDEPTIGLDFESRKMIVDFVNDWSNADNSVIITSHNILDIESICKRLIVIHEGRILYDGDVSSVLSEFSMSKNITVFFDREVDEADVLVNEKFTKASRRIEIHNVNETDVDKVVADVFKNNKHIIDVKVENISIEQVIALLVKRDSNV